VPAWAAGGEPNVARSAIVLSARPGLPDPNFDGSTILVTNSVANSPFGIVLNRPTKLTVAQLLPEFADSAIADEKVHFGGPVQIDSAWFLFRSQAPVEHAVNVLGDVYLSHDREGLRTLLQRGLAKENVRVFIGYAGWETDQLEDEIARGDWKVAPASADRIFDPGTEHPWPAAPAPPAQRI
jgi:putative transcriptional regulator